MRYRNPLSEYKNRVTPRLDGRDKYGRNSGKAPSQTRSTFGYDSDESYLGNDDSDSYDQKLCSFSSNFSSHDDPSHAPAFDYERSQISIIS